jgi:translocation and assembly module TamB
MRRFGRILLLTVIALVALLLLAVGGAYGFLQTGAGKAWLAATIARTASSPGMVVTIERLEGSPPFNIRIGTVRVADREGSWLELDDLVFAVNAGALLRRALVIERLQAASARVTRQPVAEPTQSSPSPSLDLSPPRLPLDVAVEDLGIGAIDLDPAVLGEPVRLSFQGRAGLARGRAEAHLDLRRTDDRPGSLTFDLSLDGHPAVLSVQGEIDDPRGIVAAEFLHRGDRPPLSLRIAGHGPIADWHGQLTAKLGTLLELRSDIGIAAGTTYRVTVQAEAKQNGLVPADLARSIGDRVTLAAAIAYDGKQALAIDNLELVMAAGEISGRGSLDSTSQRLDGHLHVALPDLAPLQPLVAAQLAGEVELDAVLGGSLGQPTVTLNLQGTGLHYTDIALDRLAATLDLASQGGLERWRLEGEGKLASLARTGEPLPAALGRDFSWSFAGSFDQTQPLAEIDSLHLEGESAKLAGQGHWAPKGSSGNFTLDVAALDRFAELAQLPDLAGRLHIDATLDASKAGAAKVTLQGGAEDLTTGVPIADALLGPKVTVDGHLDRAEDGTLSLASLDFAGQGISLSGKGQSDAGFQRPTGTLHLELARLADLGPALKMQLQGRLTLDGQLSADGSATAAQLDLAGEGLGTSRPLVRRLTAQIKLPDLDLQSLDRVSGTLSASALMAGVANGTNARLEASFARPDPDRVSVTRLALTANGSRITGRVDYSLSTGLASGALNAAFADLAPWSALAGTPLKGSGKMTLALAARQGQSADLTLEANDLSLGEGHGRIVMRRVSLTAKGRNLLANPLGQADLTLTELAAGQLQIGHASAQATSSSAGHLGFSAAAKGVYNLPGAPLERSTLALALDLAGDSQMRGRAQQVSLSRFTVALGEDKASLRRPLQLSFGGGNARFEDLALSLAGGSVTGSGALQGNTLRAALAIQKLPLRPFGKMVGQRIEGSLDATANLDGPASAPAGRLTLHGRDLRFPGLGDTASQLPPLQLELALAPAAGRLGLEGKVSALGDELIAASGSVPLKLSARPFAVSVPKSGEVQLRVSGEGKLQRLAQVLPLGEDRISGDYKIDLSVTGTPAVPAMGGKVTIANGSYLNQDYGTELRGLALELTGNESRLTLTRLEAHDSRSGRLEGSGSFDLAGDSPGMDLHAKLTNFLVANSDEAVAPVDAEFRASGKAASPALFGRVTLWRSEFRIPDSLPPSIANLNVVEIDSRDPERTARVLAAVKKKDKTPPAVPMALDLKVTAPGQVYVRGHGLNSEWRGDIVVTGNTASPVIGGGFTIVRGTLNVLGKDFVIRRGTIRFPSGSFDDPWVDLLAEYNATSITAQVTLIGGLEAPQLKLSSTPELPQDEILARVLFGSNAGAITPSQGLQLAFAAQSLANGGPGVLDRLRSSLGLDRLDIGSGSNGGNNASTGTPTVSGGKYVAPGVYVGVEQGASVRSSNARVEVDLLPHVTGYSSVGASSASRVGLDWRMDY